MSSKTAGKLVWYLFDYHYVKINAKSKAREDSDDDVALSILEERWLLLENYQQEYEEIGNMLQQISNFEYSPNKSKICKWIEVNKDHLAVDSDDSSSIKKVELKLNKAYKSFWIFSIFQRVN